MNRPLHFILNPDHSVTPVDVTTDAGLVAWCESWEKTRRIALDIVAPGIEVSTVFLGFDHSHGRGAPLLFETMVFDDYGGGETLRWSTWAEAFKGHQRLVTLLTKRTVKQWAAKPSEADK